MDPFMVAFRIVHIGSAIVWAGGAALFFAYIEPTINALGPDGEKVIGELVGRRHVPIYFLVASTLTVLAGAILYWRDSGGLQLSWITSATGLAFTIGGLSALAAWVGGNLLIPKALGVVGGIGGEMKAAGGPPSAELLGRMHQAQARLRRIGLIDLILIGIAVLAMAAARYLG
jgi:uncharacterized membrane protein